MELQNHATKLICYFVTVPYANAHKFVLHSYANNKLQFELNLEPEYMIYSHDVEGDMGLATNITLQDSDNLQNYQLLWPKHKQKYQDPIGMVQYYDELVKVALIITPKDISKPVSIKAELEYVICKEQCVPVRQTIESEILLLEKYFVLSEFIWVVMLAMFGGFILNFMPCVLPVLSLKVFSFIKQRKDNRKISCFFTIAGILSSFWFLAGMMIALKSAGKQFGLGVNFQVPEVIILLTIIITIFISSAMERINISLPIFTGNRLGNINFKNQYFESYFSGILATILSTPCNAPFLGTAIAVSFTSSNVVILVIFTCVALGFSLPYILLALYPPILNALPKPGRWMEALKKGLVLLLIGTVFWLLYILYNQIGQRAVIGLFMLLILLKFSIESNSNLLKNALIKPLIVGAIIIASLILPQYAYQEDTKHQGKLEATWRKFDQLAIDRYVSAGRVVFVDITADWCITCKYNKFMVLNRNKTMRLFKENKIVAMRGDFTSYDADIDNYLVSNDVIGIPFYKIYGPAYPDGIKLPIILMQEDIKHAIEYVNR
jgi:suppressor for copper-sensitivity B